MFGRDFCVDDLADLNKKRVTVHVNGDFENGISPALSLKKHITEICEAEMTQEMQRSPLNESVNGPVDLRQRRKSAKRQE